MTLNSNPLTATYDTVEAPARDHPITYWMGRTREIGPDSPDGMKPVDLQSALGKTMALSCASYQSDAYTSIMFFNQGNFDSLNILRTGGDQWNLSTPVFCADPSYCNKYITHSDTKKLKGVIRAFFKGGDWYGMVNFSFDSQMFEVERDLRSGRQMPHRSSKPYE